jgi:hypothetical protein
MFDTLIQSAQPRRIMLLREINSRHIALAIERSPKRRIGGFADPSKDRNQRHTNVRTPRLRRLDSFNKTFGAGEPVNFADIRYPTIRRGSFQPGRTKWQV